MRQAVRVIVIHDGALLVMHRNKNNKQYYTLIGGDIDPGESQEVALYREIEEETGVEVENHRLVFIEEPADQEYPQYIYLCEYVSGEPALAPDSVEAKLYELGVNLHTPMWLSLAQLSDVTFLSPVLRDRILQAEREGWPDEPQQIIHAQSPEVKLEANQGGNIK